MTVRGGAGKSRVAVREVLRLRGAGELTTVRVRLVADAVGVHKRTVRAWLARAERTGSVEKPQRRRFTITDEVIGVLADYRGNVKRAHAHLVRVAKKADVEPVGPTTPHDAIAQGRPSGQGLRVRAVGSGAVEVAVESRLPRRCRRGFGVDLPCPRRHAVAGVPALVAVRGEVAQEEEPVEGEEGQEARQATAQQAPGRSGTGDVEDPAGEPSRTTGSESQWPSG